MTARSAIPISIGVLVGAVLAAVCATMVATGTIATWPPVRRPLRVTTADALRVE